MWFFSQQAVAPDSPTYSVLRHSSIQCIDPIPVGSTHPLKAPGITDSINTIDNAINAPGTLKLRSTHPAPLLR